MLWILLLTWSGYVVPLGAYGSIDECQDAAQAFAAAHPDVPATLHCVAKEGA